MIGQMREKRKTPYYTQINYKPAVEKTAKADSGKRGPGARPHSGMHFTMPQTSVHIGTSANGLISIITKMQPRSAKGSKGSITMKLTDDLG